MRALIRFAKMDRVKFISHLDLQRFMQMALRRTELAVAYSQGFNPHPIMNFASALAMGWTSEAEIVDIKLDSDADEAYVLGQMKKALPYDLPPLEVRMVDDRHPKMMAKLTMADYRIEWETSDYPGVEKAIEDFLEKESVMALRKTKSGEIPTDIRPLCIYLHAEQTESGVVVRTRLALTEKATLKPDLLISTLLGDDMPATIHIHRVALLGEDEQGAAVPLMRI